MCGGILHACGGVYLVCVVGLRRAYVVKLRRAYVVGLARVYGCAYRVCMVVHDVCVWRGFCECVAVYTVRVWCCTPCVWATAHVWIFHCACLQRLWHLDFSLPPMVGS